jgi:hypothetical protein
MTTKELEIQDNAFLRQFETRIEGKLAKIEYSSQERKIFLTKLIIPEDLKEQGFKEDFIRAGTLSYPGVKLKSGPHKPANSRFSKKTQRV